MLFTDWYEPGYKAGGPIQSCRNIVNMLGHEFNFYIVTSDRDLGDLKPYDNIATDQWLTLSEKVKICYTSPGWLSIASIQKIILQVKPSAVYLNSMFSLRFSLMPLWTMKKMNFRGRIILAPRGMLRASALSSKRLKKKVFLSLMSFTRFSGRLIFHATDEQEVLDIKKKISKNAHIILAGNIPATNPDWNKRNKQAGKLSCVYVSRIHPIKNLLFALQVLGKVSPGYTIRFDIYGADEDRKYFEKCFELARAMERRVTVNFLGPLEHKELFSILQEYHLFFLPTLGENFGHAIIEALSAGCPVLISDKTPWKDLETVKAGWDLPLNDPDKFREVIEQLAGMDEPALNQLSKAAFDYAQDYISKADYKTKYYTLFGTEQ